MIGNKLNLFTNSFCNSLNRFFIFLCWLQHRLMFINKGRDDYRKKTRIVFLDGDIKLAKPQLSGIVVYALLGGAKLSVE